MLKKIIRNKCVVLLVSICCIICFCYIARQSGYNSAPISMEMTLKELEKQNIRVQYVDEAKGCTDEYFESFVQEQIEESENCSNIFLVNPTGQIYFNKDIILQEVEVKQVIKGKCSYDKVWISNGLSSTLTYDGTDVILSGMERSFMQTKCEYLLFCDTSYINKYSDKKIYSESENMWIGCYNVTRDCVTTVEGDLCYYDPAIEYYSTNKKLLNSYMETKHVLMDKYL